MIGISTDDFDFNKTNYVTCGFYLNLFSHKLDSDPPVNYSDLKTYSNLSKVNYDKVIVMKMKKKT